MTRRQSRAATILVGAVLAAAFATTSGCTTAQSNSLDDLRRRGVLRWGGDEEGGGPYIYRQEENPNSVSGFEIDLMAVLAERIGVRSEFRTSNWAELLNTLNTGTIDAVVNGYELSPERLRGFLSTIPYYVYELHLFARKDDARLSGWPDVRQRRPDGGKWRIGVLKNTMAHDYLTREFAASVDIRPYDGTTDAFRDVETQTLDATLTDTPAAVFYGPKFQVRQIGNPVERGYYVIYLRAADRSLLDALNDGLRTAIADGRLKSIYEKYGIWNANQPALADLAVQSEPDRLHPAGSGLGGWTIVRNNFPLLLEAAGVTLMLSVLAMPLAIASGLAIALGRLYGPRMLRGPLTAYVEIVRGTPLLLQLYVVHYGLVPRIWLPEVVRDHAPYLSAIAALALNYAAYEAEIYRSGLLAIPNGQTEAALALGLTRRQAIWHVIVPQAVRLVVPPVTNDFINLFKDTSICSVVAVVELSKRYNIVSNTSPQAFVQLAATTAALYLLMSYPLALITRRLERKQNPIRG